MSDSFSFFFFLFKFGLSPNYVYKRKCLTSLISPFRFWTCMIPLRRWSMLFLNDFFEENYYSWIYVTCWVLMYRKNFFLKKKKIPPPSKSRFQALKIIAHDQNFTIHYWTLMKLSLYRVDLIYFWTTYYINSHFCA